MGKKYKVVLASASPRRRELLAKLFDDYECVVSDVDETVEGSVPAPQLVEILAERKGRAVRDLLAASGKPDESTVIISADTVVSLGDRILTKPTSEEDAFRMLRMLSGNSHTVYTGIAVFVGSEACCVESVPATVSFSELTDEDILSYIATGDPMDKAGAYGIQGVGGKFIERIDGDFYNVMGLPVNRLWQLLKKMGVL